MTPKPAWACLDMLSSISLREDVSRGGDEKETTGDAIYYGCGGDEKKEDISSQTSTINTNKHQSRLEHSFSYNDLSHFNIDAMREQQSKRPSRFSEMTGLRADFVHLHGLYLHSKSNNNLLKSDAHQLLQQSSKHARPLLARALTMGNNTVKEVKDTTTKTIVVIPSIDLDRKELQRMCKDIEFYEERQLFHLLMANDPSVRIIYLTSRKVDENVVP